MMLLTLCTVVKGRKESKMSLLRLHMCKQRRGFLHFFFQKKRANHMTVMVGGGYSCSVHITYLESSHQADDLIPC